MIDRSLLPPVLQHHLKLGDPVWPDRIANLIVPAVATVLAWLWLVGIFGGFN